MVLYDKEVFAAMTKCLTVIAVLAGAGFAQSATSHVSVAAPGESRTGLDVASGLEKILPDLDVSKLRPVVAGSWEGDVLLAAQQGVIKVLSLNLKDIGSPAIHTLSRPDGDVLVGRWSGGFDRLERAIWLWDTPYETEFIMEVDPFLLQPNELARYCENLFVWNNSIKLESLKLTFLESERGRERVIGLAKYLQTERGIYRLGFSAAAIDGRAYATVYTSKSLFLYPRGADGVPERFPPLNERLRDVPRPVLFSELGKGHTLPSSLLTYPRERDAILSAEIVTRGPVSDAELREIIVGRFGDGTAQAAEVVYIRFIAFLQALESKNQLAAYFPPLQLFLEGDTSLRAWTGPSMGQFFNFMSRNQIDAVPAALGFLDHGKDVQLSLLHLQANIRDASSLKKLEQALVPADFLDAKKRAVETVRDRLTKMNVQTIP